MVALYYNDGQITTVILIFYSRFIAFLSGAVFFDFCGFSARFSHIFDSFFYFFCRNFGYQFSQRNLRKIT